MSTLRDVFSNPHPGWFILAIALTILAALDGESVPIAAGAVTAVLLFGAWRLLLAGYNRFR